MELKRDRNGKGQLGTKYINYMNSNEFRRVSRNETNFDIIIKNETENSKENEYVKSHLSRLKMRAINVPETKF